MNDDLDPRWVLALAVLTACIVILLTLAWVKR